jgi:hypothetical protein
VATYKLALVRALCEISQNEHRNAIWHPNNQVSIPLGLIAEKWLYYYWPLIESEVLLPQMNGAERGKQIAFRSQLDQMVHAYQKIGGLSSFNADYRAGRLSVSSLKLFQETIKAIS